jgi:tRNA uridine 5-carboxymethylaminomethyl modification enzyme
MKYSKTNNKKFDIIVVGAGHAGCEACLCASRMGMSTLLITMSLDNIAQMPCNPSIGGLAKSQLVREIDALGGEMAKIIDQTGIQFRILNTKKGPAVQAYRAQADKQLYKEAMRKVLEKTTNLTILEDTVEEIIVDKNKIKGVSTLNGDLYNCKCLIITPGTFMNGYIHRGLSGYAGGRDGEVESVGLPLSLKKIGFKLGRLKTGTPSRIDIKSIDLKKLTPQYSRETPIFFSYEKTKKRLSQIPCYVTYTNERTHEFIRNNLDRSPLYTGKIVGIGPRYCPSVEDKVVRFPDKNRHQIFLEPEGLKTNEVYVNGLSTSLPEDVQLEMIHSVEGLENAKVIRFGYGIEYDFVYPEQIKNTLETKKIKGLFFAGQLNGTSGYEEAAAQGLIAGINAVRLIQKKSDFVLGRHEAYIGVLIDDLIVKQPTEPYRMFTSLAEYRLLLRNDNADLRLTEKGYRLGLISEDRYKRFIDKKTTIEQELKWIKSITKTDKQLYNKLRSGDNIDYDFILEKQGKAGTEIDEEIKQQIGIQLKYEEYIKRQKKSIDNLKYMENRKIPEEFDFKKIKGLKKEAIEKLCKVQPKTLGQASRITGVTPADISLLIVFLKRK